MRSKLFVPGSRPELFAKAVAGEADALSFDLEDSVTEANKARAREQVADFLRGDAARASDKVLIVRTNAPDSAHFVADLEALVPIGIAMLNLPKIDDAPALQSAVDRLERIETAFEVAHRARLLVNIETPRALRHAAAIAAAHARVVGLQLGLADLFGPLGADRGDAANVHAAMFAMRMAAGEAGVFAIDAAYPDVADAEGFEREARMAHRLGFVGKSCIHPKQVASANRAFAPGAQALAAAQRIVDAANAPENAGRGAWLVDGAMIDAPLLQRARTLLAAGKGDAA